MDVGTMVDRLRINKCALSISAAGLPHILYGIGGMLVDGTIDIGDWGNTVFGLGLVTLNTLITIPVHKQQNDRYEKMRRAIEERGYDERIVSEYMDHPCGRMIVRAVLRRTDNLEYYGGLKTKYPLTRVI